MMTVKKTSNTQQVKSEHIKFAGTKKKSKSKRDWLAIVNKGFRVFAFRTLECVSVWLVVSSLVSLVGAFLIPALSFSIATGAGITQSTDFYTASALWLLPMLFFVLLITVAVFCILKKYLAWQHSCFTRAIENNKKLTDKDGAE